METYLNPTLRAHWKDDPYAVIHHQSGELIRQVNNRSTLKFNIGKETFYLKRYLPLPWHKVLVAFLCGKYTTLGAQPELRALQKLKRIGIPAPIPVGWGSRRGHSFIVTEGLKNTSSLEEHVAHWRQHKPTQAHRRALLNAVADMTRILHSCGINHQDLYLCHFHLSQDARPLAPKLYLIDLHRAQLRAQVPTHKKIKDLGELYSSAHHLGITTREQIRFVRRYRHLPLKTLDINEQRFWHRAMQRAHKIWVRNVFKDTLPKGAFAAPDKSAGELWRESDLLEWICGHRQAPVFPVTCELYNQEAKRQRFHVRAQFARQVPHHVVLRGHRHGQPLVLKIFNLRTCHGQRAWQRTVTGTHHLENCNIATPPLLSKWLSNTNQLGVCLFGDLGNTQIVTSKDFKHVLALTKKMHAHNVIHVDAHLNNFVWAQKKLYVLDMDGIRRTSSKRRQNYHLARLFVRCLPLHLQEHSARDYGIDTTLMARIRHKRLLGASVGRYCRNSEHFVATTSNKRRILVKRDSVDAPMLEWMVHMRRPENIVLLKDGSRSTVFRTQYKQQELVVKYYIERGLWYQIRRLGRPSPARRYWCNAHRLLRYTPLHTPLPVALIEEKRGFLSSQAWVLTQYQKGPRLDQVCAKHPPTHVVDTEIQHFFQTLKLLRMHHGDVKASNFIVTRDGLSIVDLDSMRVCRRNWQRFYLRDKEQFLNNFSGHKAYYRHYHSILSKLDIAE